MQDQDWKQRWIDREIGFHASEVNPFLKKYYDTLELKEGSKVFIPLCGKTLDISWLAKKGHEVIGCELSELAIKELFEELEVEPTISKSDKHLIYVYENIKIFVGDFFELTYEDIGEVDFIYDRASLVALIPDLRVKYSKQLQKITNCSKQLLITFEYDQSIHLRPPYSVEEPEIISHYSKNYQLELLESFDLEGGLKGKYDAKEKIWVLK